MAPIETIDNKPARITREIIVRPMKQSVIDIFGHWVRSQSWREDFDAKTVDEKSEI